MNRTTLTAHDLAATITAIVEANARPGEDYLLTTADRAAICRAAMIAPKNLAKISRDIWLDAADMVEGKKGCRICV